MTPVATAPPDAFKKIEIKFQKDFFQKEHVFFVRVFANTQKKIDKKILQIKIYVLSC